MTVPHGRWHNTQMTQALHTLRHKLLTIVGILLATVTAARAETWTVAFEELFPPYSFAIDGDITGIDVSIIRTVLQEAGVTMEPRPSSWARVVQLVETNAVDLGFQFVDAPERRQRFHLVGPIRSGVTVVLARRHTLQPIYTLSDLTHLRVGTVEGFRYTPEADQLVAARQHDVHNNVTLIRQLLAGRVDAVLGDRRTLAFLARAQDRLDDVTVKLELATVPRFVGIPFERPDRVERFTAALERVRARGDIDAILDGWADLPSQLDTFKTRPRSSLSRTIASTDSSSIGTRQ